MGKVNRCLKTCFIIFNALFAIIGTLLLLLAVLGHVVQNSEYKEVEKQVEGLIFMYALGILSTGVSCLGIYGAYKEKKWALIVFLIMMSLGCIGLLWFAVSVVIALPKINKEVEDKFREFLPLNEASLDVKHLANLLQVELKCCGIFNGYKDWGGNVPDSCLCPSYYQQTDKCEAAEKSLLSSFMDQDLSSTKMVYKQSCFPILEKWIHLGFSVIMGISFGFAAMTLLGLVMCIVILYQIGQRQPATGPVMFSINPKPQKYSELFNAM